MLRASSAVRFWCLACLLGLACGGCARLERRSRGPSFEDRLAQVDALLFLRADPARLEEALVQLDELMLDMGDDPRLLSRLAMAQHALAYGHAVAEPPPLRLFEAGRETAWRCIYQDPAFEGVLTSTGGLISPAAAARIGDEHARCLLWLVANWTRWLAIRDPAGFAIDLRPVQVLADRAVELTAGDRRAQALGLAGLSRALVPEAYGPDLNQARGFMLRAIEQGPDNLTLSVDLAEYVYGPLDDRASFRDTLERVLATPPEAGGRWQLENHRAHLRAQALLEAQR